MAGKKAQAINLGNKNIIPSSEEVLNHVDQFI